MKYLLYAVACWPVVAVILTILLCLLINRAKNQ